jgi:hypothetical protein
VTGSKPREGDGCASTEEVSAGAPRADDAACAEGPPGIRGLSLNGAVLRIGQRTGVNPDRLRAVQAGRHRLRPSSRDRRAPPRRPGSGSWSWRTAISSGPMRSCWRPARSSRGSSTRVCRAIDVVVAFVDDPETGSGSSRSATCSPSTACRSLRTATTRTGCGRRPPGRSATSGCWPRSSGCTSTPSWGAGSPGPQGQRPNQLWVVSSPTC